MLLLLFGSRLLCAQFTVDFSIQEPTCFGLPDGGLTALPSGGTAPYTFVWNTGDTGPTLSGLTAGTYTVTVTDEGGQQAIAGLDLGQPDLLDITFNADTCSVPFDATAISSGGMGPYTYQWSTGQSGPALTVNGLGIYCVTVTDANLCSAVDCIKLLTPPLNVAIDPVVSDATVTCPGGADASLTVQPQAGQPPYTFLWNNGATTQTIDNLPVGVYSVTVTDNAGCIRFTSGAVTGPSPITLTLDAVHPVCAGDSDGAITATAAGGNGAFTYLWSTGDAGPSISALPAGNYQVTATDSEGCQQVESIVLDHLSNLTVGGLGTPESCPGANDGSATVAAQNGVFPYSYLWENGETAMGLTGLAPGDYDVTVTDAAGCSGSTTITVPAAPDFAVTISGTDITTCGGSDGTASAVITAGTPPFAYAWNNGASTPTITGLSAGLYSVTVTNSDNCVSIDSILITEPPAVAAGINGDATVCAGADDGALSALATGGTPPFDLLWSTGATGSSVTDLPAGVYGLTVTDSNGCSDTAVVQISELPAPEVTIIATEVVCGAGNTGNATAQPGGGQPPYTYEWSTGAGTPAIGGLTATGNYSVTITDANGCRASASVTIIIDDDLEVVVSAQDADCFGAATGQATAAAMGGQPPYSYVWSTGAATPTIAGQLAGSYDVTVTDALGCTAIGAAAIGQPAPLSVSIDNPAPQVCSGESAGTLTALAGGGTPGYTYLWNTGATTPMISGLTAGAYTVTVTDANGCEETASATIASFPDLSVDIDALTLICGIGETGQASVLVDGGAPPYTYSWNTGESTESIGGLGTGDYSVTVVDANGCSASDDVSILVVNDFVINVIPRNVLCNGGASGGVLVLVTGGTEPYAYEWSTGQTGTNEIGNLPAGDYGVTITDANGCVLSETVTLAEPPTLATTVVADDPLCFGQNNGSATAVAGGGTPPYAFAWNDGQLGATAENLAAGVYTVTVTDANTCEQTMTVELTQPAELTVNVSAPVIACAGDSTGFATAMPQGGVTPYQYQWSTGATTAFIDDLPAGLYSLTVTDANECAVTVPVISITELPALMLTFDVVDILCSDENTGVISSNITGGAPPYTYLWETGDTTPGISGLGPGTYSLTVTDANGCEVEGSATVVQTPGLSVGIDITPIDCAGENTGVAAAIVNGGTGPYDYLWSNGNILPILTSLPAGTYSVTVIDQEGCSGADTVTINEPPALQLDFTVTDPDCFEVTNGEATAIVGGGVPPYELFWSTGDTTASVSGLAGGGYGLTVTDANGCTLSDAVQIEAPDAISLNTEVLTGVCEGEASGAVEVMAEGGTPPYEYLWSNGANSELISGLTAGIYGVTVTDVNGCEATASVTLDAFPAPSCTVEEVSPVVDGGDGAATVTVAGGTAPFEYLWSNGDTAQLITGLDPGLYEVAVTDANGCSTSCSLTLGGPAQVGDYVWLDADRDGLQDTGETGIADVKVTITGTTDAGAPYDEMTFTDADGIYGFLVPPGTYKLTFMLPAGSTLEPTTDNVGNDDAVDSDADTVMLMTDLFSIGLGEVNLTFDAGFTSICDNITDAGLIGPDYQFLCGPGNDPEAILALEAPSGGSGAVEYLWMSSTIGGPFNDQTWDVVPGATGPDFDPGPIYETTYFIRCARREDCTVYLESNTVTVEVGDVAVADIQGPNLVCEDEIVTFFAAGTSNDAVISWDFGPAAIPGTAAGNPVDVVFHSFGSFQVALTVTENGCTATNIQSVTVTNNPTTCGDGLNLDVNLQADETVRVAWSLEQPQQLYSFVVEHSDDGEEFRPLATVEAPYEVDNLTAYYEYRDAPSKRGWNYYRVQVRDSEGQTAYSETGQVILFNADSRLVMLYPNPVTDQLTLELFETYDERVTVAFFSAGGIKLREVEVEADADRLDVDLSDYAAGAYYLQVSYDGEPVKTLQVLKK